MRHQSSIHGQSHDPGIALEDARAEVIATGTAQGGTALEEAYRQLSRASFWLADVVMECNDPWSCCF